MDQYTLYLVHIYRTPWKILVLCSLKSLVNNYSVSFSLSSWDLLKLLQTHTSSAMTLPHSDIAIERSEIYKILIELAFLLFSSVLQYIHIYGHLPHREKTNMHLVVFPWPFQGVTTLVAAATSEPASLIPELTQRNWTTITIIDKNHSLTIFKSVYYP